MDPYLITAIACGYAFMTLAATCAWLDRFSWADWVGSFICGLLWPLLVMAALLRILRAADATATSQLGAARWLRS